METQEFVSPSVCLLAAGKVNEHPSAAEALVDEVLVLPRSDADVKAITATAVACDAQVAGGIVSLENDRITASAVNRTDRSLNLLQRRFYQRLLVRPRLKPSYSHRGLQLRDGCSLILLLIVI